MNHLSQFLKHNPYPLIYKHCLLMLQVCTWCYFYFSVRVFFTVLFNLTSFLLVALAGSNIKWLSILGKFIVWVTWRSVLLDSQVSYFIKYNNINSDSSTHNLFNMILQDNCQIWWNSNKIATFELSLLILYQLPVNFSQCWSNVKILARPEVCDILRVTDLGFGFAYFYVTLWLEWRLLLSDI